MMLGEHSNRLFAEIPRPEPTAKQVLVRIKASGVNPLDSKIRTGKAPHAKPVLPAVLGVQVWLGSLKQLDEMSPV